LWFCQGSRDAGGMGLLKLKDWSREETATPERRVSVFE